MPEGSILDGGKPERHLGMDWLRIGAFGLLILFHVGMVFSSWAYAIKLADIWWITILLFATSPWRLSLLFVVSGYASVALFDRRPAVGTFLRLRLLRLGLPLLFGVIVIVPAQIWVELATQQHYPYGFAHFMLHDYFVFRRVGGMTLPGWAHLWFLASLFCYSLLLAGLFALPPKARNRLKTGAERVLAGPTLLPIGILFIYAVRKFLPPGWIDGQLLVGDWSSHAEYCAAFLFGALLRRSPPLLQAICRQWPVAAMVGAGGYVLLATFEIVWPGETPVPTVLAPLYDLTRSSQAWGTVIALLGIADLYGNRDHPWRAPLAEAAYPAYIIHQTAIALIGYALLFLDAPDISRFLLLLSGTFVACWAFYAIGRSVRPLRLLIGLRP